MAVHRVIVRRAKWSRSALAAAAAARGGGGRGDRQPGQADDGGVSDAPILGQWEVQSLNGVGQQPVLVRSSAAPAPDTCASARRATPTARARWSPAPTPGTSPTASSTTPTPNVFSERGVSQWGNVGASSSTTTSAIACENGTASNLPFNATDPLESFTDTLGVIPFNRSAAAPGTGVTNARQQINTEISYIDAEAVYGNTDTRLDWLRDGRVDGNPDNNAATLMLPGGYLPRADRPGQRRPPRRPWTSTAACWPPRRTRSWPVTYAATSRRR